MLVRPDGVVIGQPAHAWVAGQLARAWGNAAFPAPAPREPVCLAAEQHDVGWADADLRPLPGTDGRPLGFMAVPRPLHVTIWRGAARRMLAQSRYAALLVSLHGTSLYDAYVDPDAHTPEVAAEIRAYLAGERALQAALAAGLDPDEVDRNRRLLLTWDRISLALCHAEPVTVARVPAADGPAAVRIEIGAEAPSPVPGPGRDDRAVPSDVPAVPVVVDPWPFAAPRVVVGCEGRVLPGRFADAGALAVALDAAPWRPLRWALSPG